MIAAGDRAAAPPGQSLPERVEPGQANPVEHSRQTRKERPGLASKQEIFDVLCRIMVRRFEFPAELISPDAHLVDDLDLDSLDAVDLAVELEDETGLYLDDDLLKRVERIRDIVDVVYRRLGPETA